MSSVGRDVGWSDRVACVSGWMLALLLVLPWVRERFMVEGERWLYVLLFSFSVVLALTPVMIRLGLRFNLVDHPDARKLHKNPTPYTGGIAIYAGVVLALLINGIIPQWMVAIVVGGTFLLVVSVVDDARGLPSWVRLIAQLLATGLVILSGQTLNLFPEGPVGDIGDIVLTMVWIIGITNAFNFFDGMDGLASGLAILMAFFMGIVALESHQAGVGWLAVAVVGAGLGFLPYNFRKHRRARIFLGDGGAIFLGFTLACLAVTGDWAENDPIVAFSNPILIFWLLIYDMVHVTVERVILGKVQTFREWLDHVEQDHLHHRLARAVGNQRSSVLIIHSLAVCLGLSAMVLRKVDTAEAIMLLVQAGLIMIVITILEHRGRPLPQRPDSDSPH